MADSESSVTSPVTNSCIPRQKYFVSLSSGVASKLNSLEKLSLDVVILNLSSVRGRLTSSLNHWILDGVGKLENVHTKAAVSPTITVVSLGAVVTLIGTLSDGEKKEEEEKEGERERVRERETNQNKCMKYSIGRVISGNIKPHTGKWHSTTQKSASIYIFILHTYIAL